MMFDSIMKQANRFRLRSNGNSGVKQLLLGNIGVVPARVVLDLYLVHKWILNLVVLTSLVPFKNVESYAPFCSTLAVISGG